MIAETPSPQTTLAILLGASQWPNSPQFQSSEAFANSAIRLKEYLLSVNQFKLPRENLLDLFNSPKTWDEIDEEIGKFLDQRISAMKISENAARDVLIYFIGHGGFADQSQDYHLALYRTRHGSGLRASAIPMKSLVETILEKARHLRRFMILDCCFAGSAFRSFQGDPSQGAIQQTDAAFKVNIKGKSQGIPEEGSTLLCSSDHQSASLLMPDGSSTMFSKALLDALSVGRTDRQEYLSFRDLNDLAADILRDMSLTLEAGDSKPPRPALLSPDQRRGDIADIPFFPNLQAEAERTRLAEVERVKKAEEEARLAEVERVRKRWEGVARQEEERMRRVEAAQARWAEEQKERARLAAEERVRKPEEQQIRWTEEAKEQARLTKAHMDWVEEQTRWAEEAKEQARLAEEEQITQPLQAVQPKSGYTPSQSTNEPLDEDGSFPRLSLIQKTGRNFEQFKYFFEDLFEALIDPEVIFDPKAISIGNCLLNLLGILVILGILRYSWLIILGVIVLSLPLGFLFWIFSSRLLSVLFGIGWSAIGWLLGPSVLHSIPILSLFPSLALAVIGFLLGFLEITLVEYLSYRLRRR